MRTTEIDGLRIAYRTAGEPTERPPLVLLHGAVSDSRDWLPQLDALSDDLHVVAWDAPGAGASDDPPDPFGLADWADVLARFLDAQGAAPAHVLGLSWGGALALQHYERHPQQVASLILCGAYAGWRGSLPADVVEQRVELALASAAAPAADRVAHWVPQLVTPDTPPERRRELAEIVADAHPAGMRLMAHSLASADLNHVLERIRVPTLLLWGERDERAPLAIAEGMRERIPGARLELIAGAGHLSNFDRPADFDRAVRGFLRELR